MFPLANQSHDVNDLVQDIYDEHVQDLFNQRANKLLDSAFSSSSLAALQVQAPEEREAERTTDSKDSAQKAMLAQWESLKRFAIDQRHLNDSEMYPVPGAGTAGWVRVSDFVEWFVQNNTPPQSTDASSVGSADTLARQQHNYASLQSSIGAKQLVRLLTVQARSVPTALVAPSQRTGNESAEENKEGHPASPSDQAVAGQQEDWRIDGTLTERKMIYEDFIDALVRIWTQNEHVVRVTNPLVAAQKRRPDADAPAEGIDTIYGQASVESMEGEVSNAEIGGWLEGGSNMSSSVLSNPLLNRLLLWLLSQRLRGVANIAAASEVLTK